MITRVLFGKSYNIVRQKTGIYVPSIKYPQTNSEEYASSLLPNAIYDGDVALHVSSHIECVGSGKLRYLK